MIKSKHFGDGASLGAPSSVRAVRRHSACVVALFLSICAIVVASPLLRSSAQPAPQQPATATAAARNVHIPTLLIRGGRSDVLGQAGVDELCQLVPQAETREIAQAHHMVAGDENDAFTRTILEFLEGSVRCSTERTGP